MRRPSERDRTVHFGQFILIKINILTCSIMSNLCLLDDIAIAVKKEQVANSPSMKKGYSISYNPYLLDLRQRDNIRAKKRMAVAPLFSINPEVQMVLKPS